MSERKKCIINRKASSSEWMERSVQLVNYTLVPFVKFEHAPENLRLCYKISGGQVPNRLDYEV